MRINPILHILCLLLLALSSGCVKESAPEVENAATQSDGGSDSSPSLPQLFSITSSIAGSGSLLVAYSESEGAQGYYLAYRPITTPTFSNIVSTGSPQLLTGLTNGVPYVVKIIAANEAGTRDSNTVIVTPLSSTPVAPVASVALGAGLEDIQFLVTLPYTDGNGDLATVCSVANLVDVTLTLPCDCVAGVCRVGVTGDPDHNGAASFDYTVTANGDVSNNGSALLTITSQDDAPVVAPLAPANIDEDTDSIINIPYTDPEADLATSCSVSSLSNLVITQACACVAGTCTVGVRGSPSGYNGPVSFDFSVIANTRSSNTETATFSVDNLDDAPVTQDILPPQFDEDTQSIITLSYTDDDSDPATACSVSNLVNVTETQACACALGVCTVGVTGTLNHDQGGSFDFEVTAGGQTSNVSTAIFNLDPVDDAPEASDITPPDLTEDVQSIITLSYSDVEGDPAASCAISNATNVTETQACSCNGAGVCFVGITGDADYSGAASFDYTVTANGSASNTATATLTINADDDAPVALDISPADALEEAEAIVALSYTDAESDVATTCDVVSTASVSVTTPCSCDGGGNCTVGVTGAVDHIGPVSFQYTVTTANGAVSNAATASFNTTSAADAPVANDIATQLMNEDEEKIIVLAYSDIDGDLADSCTITSLGYVSETQACACAAGVCSVGITGSPDYSGTTDFEYTVTANGDTSNIATVELQIVPVDDLPVPGGIVHNDIYIGVNTDLVLPYTDIDGGPTPNSCEVVSTVADITVTGACSCSLGVCKVPVTRSTGATGNIGDVLDFSLAIDDTDLGTATATTICPVGYISIPANTDLGTSAFCVMQYEAKNFFGTSISHPDLTPWVNILMQDAVDECRALGANYDLISNPEWMAVARNVEGVNPNWAAGSCIYTGNIGVDDACGYNAGAFESGTTRDTRARLTLADGGHIWDLSGNADEWVLWFTDRTLSADDNFSFTSDEFFVNFNCAGNGNSLLEDLAATCPVMAPESYMYKNTALSNSNRLGYYIDGWAYGLARGGHYASGLDAGNGDAYIGGPYTMDFSRWYIASYATTGFRCVYRP